MKKVIYGLLTAENGLNMSISIRNYGRPETPEP